MISKERLDRTHKQEYNTCLLSNFAVVSNYFINDKIEDFFHEYYLEFNSFFQSHGINFTWPGFGYCQSAHINDYTRSSRISGYDLLFKLYSDSMQVLFQKCRRNFNVEKISLNNGTISSGTFINIKINDFLMDSEKVSIINVFINKKDGVNNDHPFNNLEMHSITVYYDKDIYYHDTTDPINDKKLSDNWWEYNRIGDVLLFWNK